MPMSRHWTITIQGTGDHHNSRDDDANHLAEEFVETLREAGQEVRSAYFLHVQGRDSITGRPRRVLSKLVEPERVG